MLDGILFKTMEYQFPSKLFKIVSNPTKSPLRKLQCSISHLLIMVYLQYQIVFGLVWAFLSILVKSWLNPCFYAGKQSTESAISRLIV